MNNCEMWREFPVLVKLSIFVAIQNIDSLYNSLKYIVLVRFTSICIAVVVLRTVVVVVVVYIGCCCCCVLELLLLLGIAVVVVES